MGLRINQNIAAQNAYRNLSVTDGQMSKSLEKLSSGYRINRAADDAAGLAISEGLRSQVGGLKVAVRNAQDGISMVQTAEGALTEVHAILQRMRDLGVQAANDSNNVDARNAINTEVQELTGELGRIAQSTNFNGTNLLDGSAGGGSGILDFQVGAGSDANSRISVNLTNANVANVATALANGVYTEQVAVNSATAAGAWTFTNATTGSLVTVDVGAADATRTVADIAGKLNDDDVFRANYTARVNSAGTGLEIVSKTTNTAAVTAGTGATAGGGAAGTLQFNNHTNAQAAVDLITTQITNISTARAGLGALQNRFEHTINNLNVAVENLSASESRIRDTDMAQEMMSFTRAQILSQAGTAMLAQANQAPQGVLQLLR